MMDDKMIPISELYPSPTNPRKRFDEVKLQELAASIADHGVLQSILARPLPIGVGYEIVAGERRWRASRLAKLPVVPVKVRNLTDEQVVEIQLIENLHRDDLSAVEEAHGFQALLDMRDVEGKPRYTVQSLATLLGRPRSTIAQRLLLCNLPKKAVEAVETGLLPPRTAELIGRVPSAKLREAATVAVLEPRFGRAVLTYREAREMIEKDLVVSLSQADWPLDDKELLPAAGPCATCRWRSGNCPDLFDEDEAKKKPNLCLNRECFEQKQAAVFHLRVAEAESAGLRVLTPEESKRLWPYGNTHMVYDSPYVAVTEAPARSDVIKETKKSWKTLTKGQGVPVVLARNPLGQTVELLERKVAIAAAVEAGHSIFVRDVAKKAGVGQAATAGLPESPARAAERELKLANAISLEASRREMATIVDHVVVRGDWPEAWPRILMEAGLWALHADGARWLVQRVGIECPVQRWGGGLDHLEGVRQWLAVQAKDPDLLRPALVELLLAPFAAAANRKDKDGRWNKVLSWFPEAGAVFAVVDKERRAEVAAKEAKKTGTPAKKTAKKAAKKAVKKVAKKAAKQAA